MVRSTSTRKLRPAPLYVPGITAAVAILLAGISAGPAQEPFPGPVTEGANPRGGETRAPARGAVDTGSPATGGVDGTGGAQGGAAATIPGEDAPPSTVTSEIRNVGENAVSVEVVGAAASQREDRMFDVAATAKIRLNGKEVDLDSLQPGDVARLTLSPENPRLVVEISAGRVEGNELPERRTVQPPQQATAGTTQTTETEQQVQTAAWVGAMVAPSPCDSLLITQVTPESPAALADLRVGDFIIGIAGQVPPQVTQTMPLANVLEAQPGTEVSLIVWREHQRFPTAVVVEAGAPAAVSAHGAVGNRQAGFRGPQPQVAAGVSVDAGTGGGLGQQPSGRTWIAQVNPQQNPNGFQPGDVIHVVSNQQIIPGAGLEEGLDLQQPEGGLAPAPTEDGLAPAPNEGGVAPAPNDGDVTVRPPAELFNQQQAAPQGQRQQQGQAQGAGAGAGARQGQQAPGPQRPQQRPQQRGQQQRGGGSR